jgi:isopenicillin N synthase-like dioxygenase
MLFSPYLGGRALPRLGSPTRIPARKLATRTPASKFYIPSIDIAPYLHDPTSAASKAIITDIRAACLSTGFFLLTNHGVPTTLQKEVFKGASKFFALPYETKAALNAKSNKGHRGYDLLASQSYAPDVLPDLKEGFYAGFDYPEYDSRMGRFYIGRNVWPSEELLSRDEFQRPMEQYYKAMVNLSSTVLDLVAATLPYGPRVFDYFKSNDPVCPLRLLHYPPTPADAVGKKRQLGSSEHTDFGAITLLLQDGNAGLQVLNQDTGEWFAIPPTTDAYVVNIGDMLSKWTGGLYKSSMHRVLNHNPHDRYSVVFFFDGNLDCELLPLDGSESTVNGGKVLTVEGHMLARMSSSYGEKKAE